MKSVADVMSKQIYIISPQDTVFNAMLKMSEKKVSCLVVVDIETLSGIITHKDMIERVFLQKRDPQITLVGDIMTTPPITFPYTGNVLDLFFLMQLRRIKQVPIINESGSIVGVVTQTDLITGVTRMLNIK